MVCIDEMEQSSSFWSRTGPVNLILYARHWDGAFLYAAELEITNRPAVCHGEGAMTQKRKVEDYVKTIYELQNQGVVRGAYIARALNVSKATVSVSLKAMEQEGFLRIRKDHTVALTEMGMRVAEEVIGRNRAFYCLLINLGVDRDTAMEDACHLEHEISQKSFLALQSLAECQLRKRR